METKKTVIVGISRGGLVNVLLVFVSHFMTFFMSTYWL